MKKISLFVVFTLFIILSIMPITVYAGMNNVVIQFSTVGPDKYADGDEVMDGECYALVWTPTGSEFQGINADRTAAGDSKVAVWAPIAIGGKCPNVQFQIDETFANANYPDGTWGVYLLDTRKFATKKVTDTVDGKKVTQTQIEIDSTGKKIATGVGGSVSGYGQVVANVGRSLSSAGAKDGVVQSIPAGIQPPTIKDFKVVNGMAYLYLKDTSSAVSYGVAAGQDPGNLAPVRQQPVQGGGNETIIITPANEAAQFYQGIVQ